MFKMDKRIKELTEKLINDRSLSRDEYEYLIENRDAESAEYLADEAVKLREQIYGREVFTRGLLEISNHCKNNCLYCGIRRDNKNLKRYRLLPEEIMECAKEGYSLGFRTIVMQGGEDVFYSDDILCALIKDIKKECSGVAVTLSLGERSRKSYECLFDAGADRYLLRHESADRKHYEMLHPEEMSYENRMRCLRGLKDIGYQTGCGFMVGSPFQEAKHLAADLSFVEEFKPDMCGIGPFIPHHETPFGNEPQGTVELTCFLLSIIRIIHPAVLLPSTTALGTVDPKGREKGILAGANVVMPNLSPVSVRKQYELYDNKICTGEESAQCIGCLEQRMQSIGCRLFASRGDIKKQN